MSTATRILDRDLPQGVAFMLMMMGPFMRDGGRMYAELAEHVQAFLAGQGRAGQWGELDIPAFLKVEARTRRQRIEICCNLSALLPWLLHNNDLSLEEARRLWQNLRAHCPDDFAAHRYIELGLREFAESDAN
jgi:hypothetical protein